MRCGKKTRPFAIAQGDKTVGPRLSKQLSSETSSRALRKQTSCRASNHLLPIVMARHTKFPSRIL